MAEAFRSQLLRDENRVHSDQPCMICYTQCDTPCPETGTVEWEVRLPCRHTVGSTCISKWLDPSGAANNTCPMCRYVFFDVDDLTPAAVLASSDSEPMDSGVPFLLYADEPDHSGLTDEPDDSEDTEDEEEALMTSDLAWMRNECEVYCQRLDLASSPRVMAVSEHLARKIHHSWLFMRHRETIIVAFTVLLASHIMGVPRSLLQVSNASFVDDRILFGIYRFFLHSGVYRGELLDEETLGMMDRGDLETVLTYLPEERGLFLPEESDTLNERGGLETYRRRVFWSPPW